MGALEQVMEMKNKGVSENEIADKLSQSGISPKEINEAMNQARIKSAVSSEEKGGGDHEASGGHEGMQASMMPPEEDSGSGGGEELPTENISDEDLTPPEPSGMPRFKKGTATREMDEAQEKEQSQDTEEYSPSYGTSQQYSGQEYQQPAYSDYNYNSQSPQMGDADTMIEIAEQVFFEKIKSIQKQVEDFSEFKTLSQVKLDNISERLKRIETHMDRLQSEILEKVGSYGRGIDSVKREMAMMEDSFGKIVNDVADREQHKHHTHHVGTRGRDKSASGASAHRAGGRGTTTSHTPKKSTKSKKKSTKKKR